MNLYRYVHNAPPNRADPSGLQEIEGESGENHRQTNTQMVLSALTSPFSAVQGWFVDLTDKYRYLRGVPVLGPGDLPRAPAHWVRRGVNGGHYFAGELPPGALLGPHQCGPCIGVILIPPSRNGTFYAFHFTALDNPADTFDAVLGAAVHRARLRGYRAVICGGERLAGSEQTMADTMGSVRYGLDSRGIRIIGYVRGPTAQIDRDGNIYWTTPPGVPLGGY